MRTSEQYYIEKQLEPDQVLVTGKHKREPRRVIPVQKPGPVRLTEDEDNARQDAYLRWCWER